MNEKLIGVSRTSYLLVNCLILQEVKAACSADDEDAADSAEHLKERLKKEHRENKHKNKEKEETHLYTVIKVF
ncbi:hypothetical protein TSUD_252920 [Trifolium subterraneum]|nr:hypothetical protein TSUD_252920 [Trifolium subterraneum]